MLERRLLQPAEKLTAMCRARPGRPWCRLGRCANALPAACCNVQWTPSHCQRTHTCSGLSWGIARPRKEQADGSGADGPHSARSSSALALASARATSRTSFSPLVRSRSRSSSASARVATSSAPTSSAFCALGQPHLVSICSSHPRVAKSEGVHSRNLLNLIKSRTGPHQTQFWPEPATSAPDKGLRGTAAAAVARTC